METKPSNKLVLYNKLLLFFLFVIFVCAVTIAIDTHKLRQENELRRHTIEKLLLENKKLLEENIYLKEREYILSLSIKDSLLYGKIKANRSSVDSAIRFFGGKGTKD
jgi:predicted Holliday junction resolvase-like endonuclease